VGHGPPRAFSRRVATAGLHSDPGPADVLAEDDLAGLPPVAARYLRAVGVVGRPRTWSLQAHVVGRFRRGTDQPWLPMDAWQYNSAVEVARLFRMRLMVARVVPMWGWDTYREGRRRCSSTRRDDPGTSARKTASPTCRAARSARRGALPLRAGPWSTAGRG